MALFIDGPPSNIEDLTNQDSGLVDVCRVEQIDASRKLKLAHEELGVELEALFDQQRCLYFYFNDRPQLDLRHLAVTPLLKMWHTWHTLSLIYRDAYFSQLNDRFQAKWNEFRALGQSAKSWLRDLGVGLVLNPLPRPRGPILTAIPESEANGTFYLAVALVNQAGEESAPSPTVSIELSGGNAAGVQLAPEHTNACGWNVYAGATPTTLCLQNSESVAISDSWLFYPSTAVVNGRGPGKGQNPNFVRALPRLLQRG